MLMVIPLKTSEDDWALFPAEHRPQPTVATAAVPIPMLGDCPDLTGAYSPVMEILSANGSLGETGVVGVFFREETMGEAAPGDLVEADVLALRVAHPVAGGIELHLVVAGGPVDYQAAARGYGGV